MHFLQVSLVISLLFAVGASLRDNEVPFLESDRTNPSSRGTRFLVAFPQNVPPANVPPTSHSFIEVATDEDGIVEFDVVTNLGGNEVTTLYEVNSTHPKRIPFTSTAIYVTSITQRDKAISVETRNGKKVSVYVINDEAFSTDGYVALPCDAMAMPGDYRRYNYVILSAQDSEGGRTIERATQFLIITCEDDTVVTVRPTLRLSEVETFGVGNFGADETLKEAQWRISGNNMIPSKQTLLISQLANDFSGSRVLSTKPIVVISGHQCGHVPSNITACDYMASQVPPDTTWGHTFLLSPLSGRRSGDFYRFATVYDNTEVNITCVNRGSTITTLVYSKVLSSTPGIKGTNWDQYETHSSAPATANNYVPTYCCLESSNPVIVAQYSYGYTRDSAINGDDFGDPFMTIIPPIVQYLKSFNIISIDQLASTNTLRRYVTVCVYQQYFTPNNILLDNDQFQPNSDSWNAIYCNGGTISGYCTTRQLNDGLPHTVSTNETGAALFAHIYGFSVENSYAVAGGMELERISGIAVRCIVPEGCVSEGNSVIVTCTRSGDTTEQTRITVNTEDGTATAPGDYLTLNLPESRPNIRAGNLLNFRGGTNRDESISFSVQVNSDNIVVERGEDFFIVVANVRSANVITPRVRVFICGTACASLNNPKNGTVVLTGIPPGSTATYSCNAGFSLEGNSVRNCRSNGQWDSPPPVCKMNCSNVYNPTNGRVVLTGTTPGSTAIYSCNSGFHLVGTSVSTCGNNGQWDSPLPVCRIKCLPLNNPMNGTIILSGNTPGSTATYSCNSGFHLVGTSVSNCRNNGQWDNPPPVCTKNCPNLYNPTNGRVVLTGTTPGSIAAYSCNSGFHLVGTSINNCRSNGQWDNPPPVCRLKCPKLNNPMNGRVILSGTTPGSTATYSCNSGFHLVGTTVSYCMSNGQWDGPPPVCRVKCLTLNNPMNGTVLLSGITPGSTAIYSCNSGFHLVGTSVSNCRNNGKWDSPPPVCSYLAPQEFPLHITRVSGTPNSLTVQWSALKCNGTITGYIVLVLKHPGEGYLQTVRVEGDVRMATIAGLESKTKYYFQVAAENSEGHGPFSQKNHFRTEDTMVELEDTLYNVLESDGAVKICIHAYGTNTLCPNLVSFEVTLMTLNKDADSSYDYVSASEVVKFQSCETRQCVNISIIDDLINEPEERFTVSIISGSQSVSLRDVRGEVVIKDDDENPFSVTIVPVRFNTVKISWSGSIERTTYLQYTALRALNNNIIAQFERVYGPGVSTATLRLKTENIQSGPQLHNFTLYYKEQNKASDFDSTSKTTTTFTFDEAHFQIQFGPYIYCLDWESTKVGLTIEKRLQAYILKDVIHNNSSNYSALTASFLKPGMFHCHTNPELTTYRSTLVNPLTTTTTAEKLVSIIQNWVSSKPSLVLEGRLVRVNENCTAAISSLDEEECESGISDDPALGKRITQALNVCAMKKIGGQICNN